MAMPSNKSSSSPIASRPNPNLRKSEAVHPMRRSFTGNPFAKPSIIANPRSFNPNTPANSPSEHPRRSSMGRATPSPDSEDKENGKDQSWKPIRVRSPNPSKSTKNFMSPTISAASKVNASPRKEILAERKEPVRISSVSFSDLKCLSSHQTMEDSEHKVVGLTPPIFKTLKTNTDLDSMEPLSSNNEPPEPVCLNVCEESDSVNLDPSFNISPPPCGPSPAIAPLDADLSAPPYDPKTNYLSPRPQFLHYRPNPRIGYYLSKEKEGKRLEDSFFSGSFSDTEAIEETQSEDSQKELEDVTSDEVTEEEQKVQEENLVEEEEKLEEQNDQEDNEEVHVADDSDHTLTSPTNTFMPQKKDTEVKWRSKFVGLLIFLAVALLSVLVIHSPATENSALKDLSFFREYGQSEVDEFSRASFDGLARNFQVWSSNSVSLISALISHLRGAHKLAPLHYCNLTPSIEVVRVDAFSVFDQSDKGKEGMYEFGQRSIADIEALQEKDQTEIGAAEKIVEVNINEEYDEQVEEEAETFVEIEASEEMGEPEIGPSENLVKVVHVDPEYEKHVKKEASEENISSDSEEELEAAQADVMDVESSETQHSQEEIVVAECIGSEPESIVSMKEETSLVFPACKVQTEVPGVEELQAESEMCSNAEGESLKDHNPIFSEVDVSSETEEISEVSLTVEMDSRVSMSSIVVISSLVSALIGSTAYFYSKERKTSASGPSISVVKPLLCKKSEASPNDPVSYQERLSSWSWLSEPCPSEMSSIQKSSSHGTKIAKANKAESQERMPRENHRRESSASIDSSLGSPSYGSFTTYEKIAIKHKLGDEEVVTPVRRSSRILKQVTSP